MEITIGDDGKLDEIVARNSTVQLEMMDDGKWFLLIKDSDGFEVLIDIFGSVEMVVPLTSPPEQRNGADLPQHSGGVFSRPECIFKYCPYTERGFCTDEAGGCVNPNGNYKLVATDDEGDNAPS